MVVNTSKFGKVFLLATVSFFLSVVLACKADNITYTGEITSGNVFKKKQYPIGSSWQDENISDTETESSQIKYPVLLFKGTGIESDPSYGSHKIIQSIQVSLDKDQLFRDIKSFYAIEGRYVKEMNEKFQSTIGAFVIERTPAETLSKLHSETKNYPPFLIYADRARGKNGITHVFSKPLPVYIKPDRFSAYRELKDKSFEFDAEVTAAINFPVKVIVKAIKMDDSSEEAEIGVYLNIGYAVHKNSKNTIRTDELYADFPITKVAIYNIDTKNKIVKRFTAENEILVSRYTNDKQIRQHGETGLIKLDYILCSKTLDGETETFNNCD